MAQRRGNRDAGSGLGSASARVGGIAALLVLAVVAARARAAGYLPHVAGPPSALVLGVIRSIGIGVITAGLVLLAWGRRVQLKKIASGEPRVKQKLTREQRKRVIVAALVGAIVGLAYQIIMQLLGPPAPRKQRQPDQQDVPADGHGWIDLTHGHQPGQAGIGTYVTVIAAMFALVALAVVLLRGNGMVELTEEGEEQEQTKTVTRAMLAGQAAVRDRMILDARQAIVACFAAMEQALAGFGGDVAPREADTPEEVLGRGISGCRLPEVPAGTLLELFREARFSTHPMHQADRDSADRALAELLSALGATPERAR
jgi:Domain of unknown function (DUF4129)